MRTRMLVVACLIVGVMMLAAAPAALAQDAVPAAGATGSSGEILALVWQFLNSPMGITAAAGLILWVLNRIYSKKPAWEGFEGTIIAAVKWAEKQVPDDSENKAVRRLDEAMKYVVKVFEEVQQRRPTVAEQAELKDGIQVAHAQLEESGGI